MYTLPLHLHAASDSAATAVEVEVRRDRAGRLRLTYRLFGSIDRLAIPLPQPAARVDALWKHSCFEAFVGCGQGYYEFNLSPSSQWAAYRFEAYREGMLNASIPDPGIIWRIEGVSGALTATIDLPLDAVGPLGLSAVIEDGEGRKSYWALAHPDGPPDFHHAACFAAALPPAG